MGHFFVTCDSNVGKAHAIPGPLRASGGGKHIKRYAAVTTYGAPWWLHTFIFGNTNKRTLMRGLRSLAAPGAHTLWLARYGMDRTNDIQRKRFPELVHKGFSVF